MPPFLTVDSDVLCFSHLRWDFVTQRPQHLLRHAARERRVFFWEEPVWEDRGAGCSEAVDGQHGRLEIAAEGERIFIVRPHLFHGTDADEGQRLLLQELMSRFAIASYVTWYYTPMAMSFSRGLAPLAVVYDCMDELRNFAGAPAEMVKREEELLSRADVVFTGGLALYEAKQSRHRNVHAFPSSIDAAHFASARDKSMPQPEDQRGIARPRAGFYGVIDERFDTALLAEVARRNPGVSFVLLGPVAKIDPAHLPQAANIHYLGSKHYEELPGYLGGWDVALLPFAINEATRYISPTKTPEYLAAGVPVVSTPVRDVVRGYGDLGMVGIASGAEEFSAALLHALQPQPESWKVKVERHLALSSWQKTWSAMWQEVQLAVRGTPAHPEPRHAAVLSFDSHAPADKKSAALWQEAQVHLASHTPHILADGIGHGEWLVKAKPLSKERYDFVVSGAGFAGAVLAERLASQLGLRVLVTDTRDHIAGNAYDHLNEDGVLVHRYGPHIFHTNSAEVVAYLSQFTGWRDYEHRVLASVAGKLLPIPINLDTVNRLYGMSLDSAGMERFLADAAQRSMPAVIRTSEDIVVSRVGRELFELFFKNYTRKQWGVEASALDSSVAGRIPVRFDRDDRYFSDSFQAMPAAGYTAMFERMLDHPRITVRTSTDGVDALRTYRGARSIYTGPIDKYFDFRYGVLPYRSLEFRHETHACEVYQSAAVINYPNDHAYTRVTEFKYLTGQRHAKTSIVREFPQADGDPFYPIPCVANAALYAKYRELAARETSTIFCGRLASYRYFNMDQVVAQALMLYRRIAEERTKALAPPAMQVVEGAMQIGARGQTA